MALSEVWSNSQALTFSATDSDIEANWSMQEEAGVPSDTTD